MSSAPATTTSGPKRNWLAFSLRALLAFTLLACLVAAYFGNLWRQVQRRRATLAQLNALGFNHEYNFNPEIEERKHPPGPWIGRAVIGDDAYAKVLSVHSTYRKVHSVDDLRLLADLPEVQHVSLSGDWVTDEVVEHLAKARGLEGLGLMGTKITPAGFARLARIPGLKSLTLLGDNINGQTFAQFHKLPHLERLDLQACELTLAGMANIGKIASLKNVFFGNVKGIDARGLQHFSQFHNLDTLAMYNINLDEAALAEIGRIKSLKSVRFQKCTLSDETVQKLTGLSELESLSLQDMPVGDGCVDAILTLVNLEFVNFYDSQLTDEGFLKLAALPKLQQIVVDVNVTGPGTGTILVTKAGGKKFAELRPDCNVYAGGFSNRVRKYVLRSERK